MLSYKQAKAFTEGIAKSVITVTPTNGTQVIQGYSCGAV